MGTRKIIAREVPPSQCDFSDYFDNDGFREAGGENCALFIFSLGHGGLPCVYNEEDYSAIRREMENINDKLDAEKWVTTSPRAVAAYLTEKTGTAWNARAFRGYSQGDYCELVYCVEHYTDDGIEEAGMLWLGCGTEFVIDDVGGFFVVDTLRWAEGEPLRKTLAEMYGCEPEELEVELYVGKHTVADYKTMT